MEDSIYRRGQAASVAEAGYQADAIQALARDVLAGDVRRAREGLRTRLEEGVSVESLLLDHLAPAARFIGRLWESDRVAFMEVTASVGRLADLEREFGGEALPPLRAGESPRVLLAPVPGEQHTFGLSLIGTLLHRDGWDVSGTPSSAEEALLTAAGAGWYEVIGLSLGCERNVSSAEDVVPALRAASLNHGVRIVIGGALMARRPGLAADLGAETAPGNLRTLLPVT